MLHINGAAPLSVMVFIPEYGPGAIRPIRQIPLSFLLPHGAGHLRLPPPVKECRLALEEFRCLRAIAGGTRIAQMHIFS